MRIPFFAVSAALLCGAQAFAQSAPSQVDLSKFPAAAIDDVVVPVPSEVFVVLDKLGSPNWKGELRSLGKSTGERPQVALLLGTVIAEGFIAVEAEDTQTVKEIGREVLDLANAIGVRQAVVARSKSIVDKADARNWPAVRKELDGALQDVRGAMTELKDDDLAQLVSLGGWLRGTEVLTSIVSKDYKRERAELLHQPELVNYFNRRIDEMSPRLRKSTLVAKIRKMLNDIRPIIVGSGSNISPENIERVHQMTQRLVVDITASDA